MANTLNLGNGNWATKEDSLLAYNSENGNFKPLPFDFTRASSATVVNKAGLIETVGSGEPRIDFSNDAKGALLLEPTRSNIWTNSNLSASITLNGLTRTLNQTVSPSGNNDATLFNETATTGTHRFYRLDIPSTSTDFSMSFFAKKNGINIIRTVAQGGTKFADFNLSLGTVSNESGVNSSAIEDYGNGWYRCVINVTAAGWVGLYALNDSSQNSYIGNVSKGVYLYGASLEQGSYATSYIPTQGSAVTRSADVCNNGGNEQVINSTEGVLYGEVKYLSNDIGSGVYSPISISGGSTNFVTFRHQGGASNRLSIFIYVNNVEKFVFVTTVYDLNNYVKIAVLYSSSGSKVFINGTVAYTDTINSSFPSNSLTKIEGFQGGDYFYGNVKDLRLYNTALTDTELQALTK